MDKPISRTNINCEQIFCHANQHLHNILSSPENKQMIPKAWLISGIIKMQWVDGNRELFITFTTNPISNEVQYMLSKIPGQPSEDRPEIVTRVLKIKLDLLIKDSTEKQFFEKVNADSHMLRFFCGSLKKQNVRHPRTLIV
ncbi:Helitron helicase-like domain [Dillenia turbinata]|uniref:Helitron helicase-like domain n=1 Tax=Dillenia turbinata TaxID=194707 RepID=A0AAN8URR2_9MAGN